MSTTHIGSIKPRLLAVRDIAATVQAAALAFIKRQRKRWLELSLVAQFIIMASSVMASGMVVLGSWVVEQVEAGVVSNAALSTAFYLDSYVEPLVQGLATGEILPPPAQAALDRVLSETHLGQQIINFKLLTKSGALTYNSSRHELIKMPSMDLDFHRALSNDVYSKLGVAVTGRPGSEVRIPVLAIVSPIHRLATSEVIAVVELHLDAALLEHDVQAARRKAVLAVAIATGLILATLFGVVKRGSTTIEEQRSALQQRVEELSRLLSQNEELRRDLVDARARSAAMNERGLRRIGAELHDGPAQLIGLALLRYSEIDPGNSAVDRDQQRQTYGLLHEVLKDSLTEIRTISYGIAPPELDGITLAKALELAACNHEKRTGTVVRRRIGEVPLEVPSIVKTCIYRFAQEGLSNGFRHAGGIHQQLEASCNDGEIVIRVGDAGCGFTPDLKVLSGGLGLAGLRDRIESVGGKFAINSTIGKGTWLSATFHLS